MRLAHERAIEGDWKGVSDTLQSQMESIEAYGEVDTRVRAHSLLGRAAARLDDPTAQARCERARDLWSSPDGLEWLRQRTGHLDYERRIPLAVEAAAEAVLQLADLERLALVDSIVIPAYELPPWKPASKPVAKMTQAEFQQEMERRRSDTEKVKAFIHRVSPLLRRMSEGIEEVEVALRSGPGRASCAATCSPNPRDGQHRKHVAEAPKAADGATRTGMAPRFG